MKIVILSHYSTKEFKNLLALKEFQNEHPYPWVKNLAVHLSKIDNVQVHVITKRSSVKHTQHIIVDKVNYHFVKSSYKYIKYFSFQVIDYLKIYLLIKKINPDIVHGLDTSFYGNCALSFRKKCIITVHGLPNAFWDFSSKSLFEKIVSEYEKYLTLRVLYKAKNFIVISPYIEQFIKKHINSFNSEYIENPISDKYFIVKRNREKTKNKLIWIGSIQERKGVVELIEIINQIPDVELDMVFSFWDNEYFDKVNLLIEKYSIKDRIHLLGYKNEDEIKLLFDKSFLLLLTSKQETAPMVIAEAMASGVPVIAMNSGGIKYMIEDAKNGYVIEQNDIQNFSKKVRHIMNDDELYESFVNEAIKSAYKRFHPEMIAKKTLQFYQKILN